MDRSALIALILTGALTPGPNNLIVLRAAGRGGWRGATPRIAAVIAGGLLLLGIAAAGAGPLMAYWPWLRRAIVLVGCGYLCWLGARLLRSPSGEGDAPTVPLPDGSLALATFQLLNPKAWWLALTALALTAAPTPLGAWLQLVPLFVLIPAGCLALWATAGGLLERRLRRPGFARIFDRLLGAWLLACALGLALA